MLEVHGVEICKHLEAIQLFGNVGSVFFFGAWQTQQGRGGVETSTA